MTLDFQLGGTDRRLFIAFATIDFVGCFSRQELSVLLVLVRGNTLAKIATIVEGQKTMTKDRQT
jgi:hypothetical protein